MLLVDHEIKIPSKVNPALKLRVLKGHFATIHSHINCYIDMTMLKTRQSEAEEVAKAMAADYQYNKPIDTIVCTDGCEVIGAYLAEELKKNGVMSLNKHDSLYVVTPEFGNGGQMIFRDNLQPMIRNKNILLLLASATTGRTIARGIECIQYYGGIIQGVSSIFSASGEIFGHEVNHIFSADDLPDYETYSQENCPYCQRGQKIDAMVNSFGYSEI
ncbi:MAG: orotate phosphoribosyltransferase [Eubacterium sp.]|nr:orotate phosphoribosyltransferase [Eubacterium sp.]